MKPLTAYAIGWGIAALLLMVFAAPLNDGLGMLMFFVEWIVVLAGGVLGLTGIVVLIRRNKAGLVALLIVLLGLTLFYTVGFRFGRLVYFQLRKSHYEQLLADATRTGTVPQGKGYTDEGPPVRFAFYWQRGILDNWAGVVYDPTGAVTKKSAVLMFGGELRKVEKLQGHWYLCWFT